MGWKMVGNREDFDKAVSSAGLMPEPVALCGVALPKGSNPFQSPTVAKDHAALTRHHVIPHHLLIETWNHAVDSRHFDVIKALTVWAGRNPTTELPGTLDPLEVAPAPDPQEVLKRVAWNPFNIVIGPKMEHRVGDPGSSFDKLVFRSLGSFDTKDGPVESNEKWRDNLARQDFNIHVERLQRIYNYMVRYVQGDQHFHSQEVASLCSLLRSDVPAMYGSLNDGKKSLVRFGGSILAPELWQSFSFKTMADKGIAVEWEEMKALNKIIDENLKNPRMPDKAKEKRLLNAPNAIGGLMGKEPKVLANAVKWGVVSWSSESYLPETPPPENKALSDIDVWEPGTANLPPDRLLLSKATYTAQTGAEFRQAVVKAARQSGKFSARVMIVGPRGTDGAVHASHDNVVKWTVEAVTSLKADGYNFKIAKTFLPQPALEVRFYGS